MSDWQTVPLAIVEFQKDLPQLRAQHREVLPGRWEWRWFWEGPKEGKHLIGLFELMEMGQPDYKTLYFPDRTLHYVETYTSNTICTYYADEDFWRTTILKEAWGRFKWSWRRICGRFIYTLMVWGLAYVPEGEAPKWNHVKIWKKRGLVRADRI